MDGKSTPNNPGPHQSKREPWKKERLVHERVVSMGQAVDASAAKSYGSAFNSYLDFVRLHDLPVKPTEDTLSFDVVYMCSQVKPKVVKSYLLEITNQLESFFPNAHSARLSPLVIRTIQGCVRIHEMPTTTKKRPLSVHDITRILDHYAQLESQDHDDLLFQTLLLTGFFALMKLSELVFPDDKASQDWKKLSRRSTVKVTPDQYGFLLPFRKADGNYDANKIIVSRQQPYLHPYSNFKRYINSRDHLLPAILPLWVMSNALPPTRSFFIRRLRPFCYGNVGGQSIRAGGAIALTERRVSPTSVQDSGRWSCEAFQNYIRKNPILFQALILQ